MICEQVINYLLKTQDTSFIVLNNLEKKYFPEHEKEFSFIYDHFKNYGNIPDKETFLSEFPDFPLFDVSETPQFLIEELFKEYQKHQLVFTFNNIKKSILDNDTDHAMEIFQKAYEGISAGVALHSIDILQDTSRYKSYLEKTTNFDKYFIRTGFPELDAIIGGWDREEELAVVMGRTNQGKSMIALKMALAASEQGLNVGLYSGEMSENKVGYRIDTLLQHISNGALIHGSASVKDDYKTYIDNLPNRLKGHLRVLTPKMINGTAGVNSLRAFIEKEKLDILFIDQHSLLDDDRHAKNPIERAANISKDLKNLQVLKRIPIIAVSQQNRTKNEDGSDRIDTTQIAQSDRIGQDATIIIGISRDKKDNSLMTLQIVKSRDSVVGDKLTYRVDFNHGLFQYIPGENDQRQQEELKNRYSPSSDDSAFDLSGINNEEDPF